MDNQHIFKIQDESIIFNGVYMEAYIPEHYFNGKLAIQLGDVVELFGVFNYRVFDKVDDVSTLVKLPPLQTFAVPSTISTKPSAIEKSEMSLDKNMISEPYMVLSYYKGDKIMITRHLVKSIDNVEKIFKLLNGGKIPNTIPYEKLIEIVNKCTSINGVNLNVSSVLLEVIISEICRDRKDKSKPFRMRAGKTSDIDQLDYKPANLREISRLSSTFSAITFEDFDTMVTSSIVRNREGGRESYSPIEKILRY